MDILVVICVMVLIWYLHKFSLIVAKERSYTRRRQEDRVGGGARGLEKLGVRCQVALDSCGQSGPRKENMSGSFTLRLWQMVFQTNKSRLSQSIFIIYIDVSALKKYFAEILSNRTVLLDLLAVIGLFQSQAPVILEVAQVWMMTCSFSHSYNHPVQAQSCFNVILI